MIWFFGLSGAGKTTLAKEVLQEYKERNIPTILLDGDVLRNGINKNLGFSKDDRSENVRRIAEICKLMLQANVVPIVAAITPYESDRTAVENIIGKNNILLVHVKCPINICEERDPKGLYALARKGKIKNFTGISDAYEETKMASITIDTEKNNINNSISKLLNFLSTTTLINI
ncbi:adenylyl-sulfate kinase [Flavivirga spongiicola]